MTLTVNVRCSTGDRFEVSAELSETVAEFKATLAAKSSIPAGPFARLVRKERLRCAVPAAAPACLPPASTVPSAAVAAPDTNHRWRKVEVLSARAGVLRRPSNLSHSHTSLPLCSRVLYPHTSPPPPRGAGQQRLIYRGRVLKDEMTLESYGTFSARGVGGGVRRASQAWGGTAFACCCFPVRLRWLCSMGVPNVVGKCGGEVWWGRTGGSCCCLQRPRGTTAAGRRAHVGVNVGVNVGVKGRARGVGACDGHCPRRFLSPCEPAPLRL